MTVFQRLCKNLLVAIITLAVTTTNLSARWDEHNQCDLEVISYQNNIKVNADGSSEEIVEYRIKALNDIGRGHLNALSITYDKALMDIDILAACTITNGNKYIVDLTSTLAISSSSIDFKDKYEISINFPKVEVGSEVQLSLKYTKKVVFPNHYYNIENYNNDKLYEFRNLDCVHYYATIKHAHCKITSEMPLYVKINDPHNVLSIKTDAKSEQGSFNVAEITLNKPLATLTVDEPRFHAIIPDEYLTWVSVSSFNKWEDYSTGYDYFAALAQKLPQIFADIAHRAKNYTNEEEQIGFVMSTIIDTVQYKSNEHAIRGLFVSRDLQAIASTQMGNCIELSISTGAILQKLGYKVYPTLVYKLAYEDGLYKEKPYLPSPYHFNHAIIKVVGKTGQVYWLDPTNIVVSVDRALPDIADKMALVFTDSQTASYEYIPQVDYNHAKVIEELVLVKYDYDNNIASFQGKKTYEGATSLNIIRKLLLPVPNQLFNNYDDCLFFEIIRNGFLGGEVRKKHVALLTKIKSRFLQDIAIKYEFDMSGSSYSSHATYNSNLGKMLVMPSLDIVTNHILSVISDQVSDIILCEYPYTLIRKFVIKGQKIKNVSNLNFKINTKWVDIERICQYVDDDTEIITSVKFYKRIIRSADLKTQEYKMLQETVKDMLLNTAIVLE